MGQKVIRSVSLVGNNSMRRRNVNKTTRERIGEQVAQLTRNYKVKTQYYVWSKHRNKVKRYYHIECASLLEQLIVGAKASSKNDEGRHVKNNVSRMPRMDHIDLVSWIAHDSAAVISYYGMEPHKELFDRVLQAGSLVTITKDCPGISCHTDKCELHILASHIRSWYVASLVTVGWWDSARDLKSQCPLCNEKTLIARTNPLAAWCIGCHEGWDETNIGILAEYVRNSK